MPEVVKVLAAEFDGHPMREQNLSEWRKGGYREWLAGQEAREILGEMVAEGGELKNHFGESVVDKLAGWLIPQYMGLRVRFCLLNWMQRSIGRFCGRSAPIWWLYAGVIIMSSGCIWKANVLKRLDS